MSQGDWLMDYRNRHSVHWVVGFWEALNQGREVWVREWGMLVVYGGKKV